MRPTVPELLEGLERLLTDEVGPYVDSPHAREVLANVATSIVRVRRLWLALAAHLDWDNREMERLLAEAVESLTARDPALAAQILAVVAEGSAAGASPSADDRAVRNAALRDALAAVVRCLAGPASPPVIDRIRDHLREALRRAP